MKPAPKVWLISLFALGTVMVGANTTAQAQTPTVESPIVKPSAEAPGTRKVAAALRFDKIPLREVVESLVRATGVTISVDSASANVPVTLNTTPGMQLGMILQEVKKLLPEGSELRLVALPVAEPMANGDVISRYLAAQSALRPLKQQIADGAVAKANMMVGETLEIAGRTLPFAQATAVMTTLDLRPVFLIANPKADNAVAKLTQMESERLQLWMGMTPDQRKQSAEAQMSSLLNMDSPTRQALFGQMMEQSQAAMQKIQSLPPDQRAQFFRDITGGRFDGTTPPRPSGNGNNGGGQQP